MELIVAELSEFTRRSRSLVVAHGETELTRGLEYGERILVRSGEEYRTAVVVDIDFDLRDTIRLVQVKFGMLPDGHPTAALLDRLGVK